MATRPGGPRPEVGARTISETRRTRDLSGPDGPPDPEAPDGTQAGTAPATAAPAGSQLRWSRSAGTRAAPRPLHWSPAAIGLVMAGGVAGAAARDAVAQRLGRHTFPVATLTANLSGAFLLGLLLEGLARAGDDGGRRRQLRLLAGTGFMGAYTTYSTFAVETVQLVHHAHAVTAAIYAAVTVFGGLVAVGAGVALGAAGHAAVPRHPDRPLPLDPDVDVDPDFDDADFDDADLDEADLEEDSDR